MTLSTYAHLFDEHEDGDHRPAEEQIRAARLQIMFPEVSVCVGALPRLRSMNHKIPGNQRCHEQSIRPDV